MKNTKVLVMNKVNLFPHQQQAINETKGKNKVAYYLDMGLGKTFVGSEKMIDLETNLNMLVCQKTKIDDWVEHFESYYSNFQVLDCTISKNIKLINEGLQPGHKYILVINYDLLFRRPLFKTLDGFTLMLDESSMIQNDEVKRTKFVLQMQPENVILLSGTPTSGKYENLWSQLHLLGWNISKKLYNQQYVNWKKIDVGGFPMWIVDKDEPYKNVDRLKRKMREYGAVFMKSEDCFDLPEQIFIEVKTSTTKEYRTFQKTCLVKVPGTEWVEDPVESDFYGKAYTKEMIELIGDTTLTKRLYSRQLCGHYNGEKLQAFRDLVTSTNDRLIVFYNFNAELDVLKKIATALKRPISEVNGHVKDMVNYENEDNSITFIQYQAGAMGLNLQKANKIIYFTLTEKSELFEQSKKRIHRIGQTNTCFYYLMSCKNSVEEKIYETLKMRKDYTDELFKEYQQERSDNHV